MSTDCTTEGLVNKAIMGDLEPNVDLGFLTPFLGSLSQSKDKCKLLGKGGNVTFIHSFSKYRVSFILELSNKDLNTIPVLMGHIF